MRFLTKMTDEDGGEVRVAPRGDDRDRVTRRPDQQAHDPLLETEAEGCGDRPVDDRQSARRATQKDRRSETGVDRHLEALERRSGPGVGHQTSAPPPKLKKLRKKEDAANAIERPKTIWISRRNPPDVSPKASVSPVVIMMITATILATGPWTDSSTCWSGCSHGMPDTPAQAGGIASVAAIVFATGSESAGRRWRANGIDDIF